MRSFSLVLFGLTALSSAAPLSSNETGGEEPLPSPNRFQLISTPVARTRPFSVLARPRPGAPQVYGEHGADANNTRKVDGASTPAHNVTVPTTVLSSEADKLTPYIIRGGSSMRQALVEATDWCAAPCLRVKMDTIGCHKRWQGIGHKPPSRSFDCLCHKSRRRDEARKLYNNEDAYWTFWQEVMACIPARCRLDPAQLTLKSALWNVCTIWKSPRLHEWEREDVRDWADRVLPPIKKKIVPVEVFAE